MVQLLGVYEKVLLLSLLRIYFTTFCNKTSCNLQSQNWELILLIKQRLKSINFNITIMAEWT